ncbi:MAG: HEAT repeat domain-containing protein [Candidatus Binatia bacterium]
MVAKENNGTPFVIVIFALLLAAVMSLSPSDAAEEPNLDHWAKVLVNGKADTPMRLEAARKLGESKDPRYLEVLTRTLKDDKKPVRWAAVEALWDLGDKNAVPSLIEYLDKRETYQWGKILTMNALGSLRDSRAVDSLLRKLKNENPFLRRSAALALVQIGDKRAIPGIIGLLNDKEGWLKRLAQGLLFKLTKGKFSGEPPRGYEAWLKWYRRRGQHLRIKAGKRK